MFSARIWLRVFALTLPLLMYTSAFAYVMDDEVPDVTGRVARVSLIDGDVQVRRSGAQDWEKAVQNLPLVEGDEIASSMFGRVEIQFDSRTYVRLEEKSVVRITTLKDEGIALSVPQGTVSVRVTDFDKEKSFLEIDIPNSTIALQKSGFYRVDVGDKDSSQARVRSTEGGEARVYSDTSGFTLRNGRAATIFLNGSNAGEWETADASAFTDSFDNWALDRDSAIAKRLHDSYYDKYYDRDIYGADDLTDYGEWVYTRTYGYVWRPYRASVANYSDWSPYRYGHWRWFPPYGWTWINDEPWGWATYHYGRWVWDSGSWSWTPYGYYRNSRSWWQPALVVIDIIANNVCWYPLPYHNHYHNYYGGHHDGRGNGWPHPTPTPNPIPSTARIPNSKPTPSPIPSTARVPNSKPFPGTVPPGAVVMTTTEQFGQGRNGIGRPPIEIARTVLSRDPETDVGPSLPPISQVSQRISKEIRVETPPIIAVETRTIKTGAAERTANKPLDEDLRRTRVLGNRPPLVVQNPTPDTRNETLPTEQPVETRRTGAVQRPVVVRKSEPPAVETPPYVPPIRTEDKKVESTSRRSDQPKTEQPRVEQPKSEPTQRREEPKPQPAPTQRDSPPAPKSEPKSEPKTETRTEKPSAPAADAPRKKDGR